MSHHEESKSSGLSNYISGEEDVPPTTSPKKLTNLNYVLLRE